MGTGKTAASVVTGGGRRLPSLFGQVVRSGVVTDQADLARLGGVCRARTTQIMNLLLLAPDIQEKVLFLPLTERGKDRIMEQHLRPIVAQPDWREQRRMWKELAGSDSMRCQNMQPKDTMSSTAKLEPHFTVAQSDS